MSFSNLGLCHSLVEHLATLDFHRVSKIQEACIPRVLAGSNIFACAETGTGKTASFVLPLIERLHTLNKVRGKRVRSLVIAPTRELAQQIFQDIARFGAPFTISTCLLVGGEDIERQKAQLIYGHAIIVATPGRLIDLLHQRSLYLDEVETLVLDEADRMLDMGFYKDILSIIERVPTGRQCLLFSATLSNNVKALADEIIPSAQHVDVTSNASPDLIKQWAVAVDKDKKSALLAHLIQQNSWNQALIFVGTKAGVAKLAEQLDKRGVTADTLHSGRSQAARQQVMKGFKSGDIQYLIATDVAARGIDINNLACVVNYDLPDDAEDFIHRIGRTGRAGNTGEAITLVSRDDAKRFFAIERRLAQIIPRWEVTEFPVKKPIPASNLDYFG